MTEAADLPSKEKREKAAINGGLMGSGKKLKIRNWVEKNTSRPPILLRRAKFLTHPLKKKASRSEGTQHPREGKGKSCFKTWLKKRKKSRCR